MASSMIHICVANEVNKIIKKDRKSILIGSIAPDISKLLNQDKVKSHFLDNSDTDVPNIQRFLSKYEAYLDDDFVFKECGGTLAKYVCHDIDCVDINGHITELADACIILNTSKQISKLLLGKKLLRVVVKESFMNILTRIM